MKTVECVHCEDEVPRELALLFFRPNIYLCRKCRETTRHICEMCGAPGAEIYVGEDGGSNALCRPCARKAR